MTIVKEEIKKMIDNLPDTATWDDFMYEMYVRSQIEEALEQEENGEVHSQEEVERIILSE